MQDQSELGLDRCRTRRREGAQSELFIAHYGSMPGSYSVVVMFPETKSAIVVLTDSTPRCDLADWMTQLLTQTTFDFPKKHDYVYWVRKTVDAELDWHRRTTETMEKERKKDTHPRSLSSYVGNYWNTAKTLLIQVKLVGEELQVLWEGREDEAFPLRHYEADTFSWLQPRNDLVSRERTVGQPPSYYMLRFQTDEFGNVDKLFGTHDNQLPQGEQYVAEPKAFNDGVLKAEL